jgi:hypothetical protein
MAALLLICGLALFALAGAVVWYAGGWRMGWTQGPPQIASNMWPTAGPFSPSWTRRLRERFPIGSSEKELLRTLQREGFEIDYQRRFAAFGWARYPCVYTLTARWRADSAGRVREVEGGLLNACTQMRGLSPQRPPRPRPPDAPRDAPSGAPEPALVPGRQSA